MPREKIAIVTGASDGIGLATARALAAGGARLAMVCRDRERGEAARRLVDAAGGPAAEVFAADLSSQAQTRLLAAEIGARYERVDILIHNAAAIYSRRTLSEDGIEMQLAVNHLAPFLLTHLLRGRLEAAEQGRVICLSSRAHRRARLDLDDLDLERGYHGVAAYARSKLANLLFTYELARRLAGTRVTANAVLPGLVRTDIGYKHSTPLHGALHRLLCLFAAAPEVAAGAVTKVACDVGLAAVSGRCFARGAIVETSPASCDADLAARLWRISAERTGCGD